MNKRVILLCAAGFAVSVALVAVLVIPHKSARPQKRSVDDLAEAQGRLDSYSFLDDSRGMHQYSIRLTGYRTTFQVPSDFVKYFATARFESQLKKGDDISISIPTESAAKLVSSGPVPVFAVRSRTATYLDEHYTISAFNNRGNSRKATLVVDWRAVLWGTAIIFTIGIAFVIWKVAKAISARSPKPEGTLDSGALDESMQRLKKVLTKRERKPKLLTMGDLEPKTNEPTAGPVRGEVTVEQASR